MTEPLTRRRFLTTTTSAAIGASMLGRAGRAMAAPKRGANETVNSGLIGCGSRGSYLAYIS